MTSQETVDQFKIELDAIFSNASEEIQKEYSNKLPLTYFKLPNLSHISPTIIDINEIIALLPEKLKGEAELLLQKLKDGRIKK